MVAVLILIGLLWLGRRIRRRLPSRRRWRAATAELNRLSQQMEAGGDVAVFAAGISQLLRRAVRLREPAAIGRYGMAWHEVLQRLAPDADTARPLVNLDLAMYRPGAPLEVEAVSSAARAWLRHVLLAGAQRA